MGTVYACTHIIKEAEKDDYEGGVSGRRNCIMDEGCNILADSLPELIRNIGAHCYLNIDDVFIPDDEDGEVTHIGYNRLERIDCEEPTEGDKERWKRGELALYLADYTFMIEKRETSAVRFDEFKAAGIKTH